MSEVSHLLDVFSAAEIARAAGTDERDVRALIDAGRLPTVDGRFVSAGPAVEAVRGLRAGALLAAPPELFHAASTIRREVGTPLTGSAAAHVLMLGSMAWLLAGSPVHPSPARIDPANLVFLVTPGPGGGGGGGGLKQATPAPRAELRGTSLQRSPVQTVRVDRVEPAEPRPAPAPDPEPEPKAMDQAPPPAAKPEPEPPVLAPVATRAADVRDRTGLPDTATDSTSHGSGDGGGAGTGRGTGLGEGSGSGIGAGSDGGTGGGPYRPGSGVTPPSLLKEVKPDYTEDARRRGITGDVELEIVVRSDGSVGDIRLIRGLGAGLDQRAMDAVRQWRFSPARRQGRPVDVAVEVAVEFKLR